MKRYRELMRATFESEKFISDEENYRALAHLMVERIPLTELAKIFNLEKIDPRTEENRRILNSPIMSIKKARLLPLAQDRTIEFEVSIYLKDDEKTTNT